MPAYAVRYFGVENLVKMLRAAKQGMEQLDDLGLTGEPNSDDAGLETAVLPSEMQEEGATPTLAVGGMPTIKPGAVTTTALTNQPTQQTQFGVAPPAAIQPAAQPAMVQPLNFATPSPLTQQMYRPTAPIRPPGQQNVTYPEYQYSPTPGGTGYGVAEYVGPDGRSIFVTTINGKPIGQIPEGYVTRAEYTKKQEEGKTTTPPTELQRKPEDVDPGDVTEGYNSESDNNTGTTEGLSNSISALINLSEKGLGILGNLGLLGMGASALVSKGATMALSNLVGKEGMTGKNDKGQTTFIDYSKNPKGETLTGKKAVLAAGKTFEEAAKAAKAEGYNYYSRDPESGQHIPTNVKGSTPKLGAMQTTPFGKTEGKTDKSSDPEGPSTTTAAPPAPPPVVTPAQVAAAALTSGQQLTATPSSSNAPSVDAPSFDPSAAPGGISAADVAAGGGEGGTYGFKKGGLISMSDGGMITVGDKTYSPEDFGFASKGALVKKRKTPVKKKGGDGLAAIK